MPRTLDPSTVVTDRAAYAAQRAQRRAEMMPLRALRRLRLGDRLAVEFENAETLGYQVQEMVYAEGLTDPADVAAEAELYGRLLPASHELTATLFVELEDPASVRAELDRLDGVQHALTVEVAGRRVPGVEQPGPDEDGPSRRTASVHFVRFRFDDAARDAFRDPRQPARLVVDHPAYADDVAIDGETRRALLADLALDG